MIARVLMRLCGKRVDLDFLKWFFYLLVGTIISLFAYCLFIMIPNIYVGLSKLGCKIGNGAYRKLNSTVLTNYIYLVLLIVAFFGLHQIREAKKAREMNSLSAFFKFLYDVETVRIKGLIRENKTIFLNLNTVEAYKKENGSIDVVEIREDLKALYEKTKGMGKGIEQFSQILTLYNNIGLLVERDHLELKNLPSIFPKNVIVYWEIFEKYVRLKRIADDPIKINSKEIKYDFYAEHFEVLHNKCRNYLANRYL